MCMQLRRRDPSAIEPLYRAHFDAIFRYAACRVGRDVALDVTSETFAQALRSLDRLDMQRDARAWLFGVATNVLRHHRRAEGRRLRAYEQATQLREETGAATDQVDAQQVELVAALGDLEPVDREALLLFAWADLTYDQIAEALEVPVGTVRSRIFRARRALRSELSATGNNERHTTIESELRWTS